MRRQRPEAWLVVVFVILGAVVGSLVGKVVSSHIPALGTSVSVAWRPGPLNLGDVLEIVFGFRLNVSVLGALGAICGALASRRF